MAKRIKWITIEGRKFPLSFSLAVLKQITSKSGGVEKMADLFIDSDGMMRASHIDNVVWMLETMMKSGVAYMNTFGKNDPREEGAALDENGNYKALTQEELELVLDMDDAVSVIEILLDSMGMSQETELETKVEGGSKNELIPPTE